MTRPRLPGVEEAVRGIWPLLSLAVILVVLMALCSLGPVVLQRVATDALIKLVMVVGLYVFVGNSGVLSFGHASFMMLGGYGAAWLDVPVRYKSILMDELPAFLGKAEFHPGLVALAAMGWAGAFAFLIGIPLMRLSGIGAAIGTFSWLTIVFVVHAGWEEMTGGTSSFNGLPIYVDIWVALIAALFVMLVAYVFQTSKLGLAGAMMLILIFPPGGTHGRARAALPRLPRQRARRAIPLTPGERGKRVKRAGRAMDAGRREP